MQPFPFPPTTNHLKTIWPPPTFGLDRPFEWPSSKLESSETVSCSFAPNALDHFCDDDFWRGYRGPDFLFMKDKKASPLRLPGWRCDPLFVVTNMVPYWSSTNWFWGRKKQLTKWQGTTWKCFTTKWLAHSLNHTQTKWSSLQIDEHDLYTNQKS